MNNRREFLKNAGLATLAGILLNKSSFGQGQKESFSGHSIGLQLFTFFGFIDDAVPETLKKISDIGYREIESAFSKKGGYYGLKPKEFASMVASMGMAWKSHHVLGAPFKLPKGYKMPLGSDGKPMTIPTVLNLRDNMQQIVDEASEGGIQYLVCANTPIASLEEVHSSIEVLNKTGEACKKAGINFCYHNHDMEFHAVEGKVPYDLFLSDLNPTQVMFELDLAWSIKGGADPVALFKAHPGRFPLWHVKDLDASRTQVLPVGSGTLHYAPIFEAASTAGMKHFFVEHDMPKDALSSIQSSFTYLKQKLEV